MNDQEGGTGVAPQKLQEAAAPRIPPPARGLRSDPRSKYPNEVISQQRLEAIILTVALVTTVGLTFYLWQFSTSWWCLVVLAALAGVIAGLLHSLKWFYRTVGDGEWEKDRVWWRYLNPLVCGVMGLSIYIVLRSGIEKGVTGGQEKDALVAYSVGFLTGLFADNAMNKLRDIAHVLFGATGEAPSKPPRPPKDGHPHA